MSPPQMELPFPVDSSLDALRCPLGGTSLIEASAGTGKTYAITILYLRLLLERGLRVDEILVVTYTRAATSELRDRIRLRLRAALLAIEAGHDDRDPDMDTLARMRVSKGKQDEDTKLLTAALRSFDQASIFTIHGFCQRVLQDSAFESGADFDTEFLSDQGEIVTEIVNDFWAREMYGAEPAMVRFLMGATPSINLKSLEALARSVTQNPTMPIVPQMAAGAANDAIEAWASTQADAAALWKAEREQILALLDGNPALKLNMYKPGQASGPWAQEMDRILGVGQLGVPGSSSLVKFTSFNIKWATKKGYRPPAHAFFTLCEELIAISSRLSRVAMAVTLRLVDYARTELAARKRSRSVQSYDDLLFRLSTALEGKGGKRLAGAIRFRFPGALIDEFQDTDPMQYRIFAGVYGGDAATTSLFLIGDPKQAIYAFRGADVFAYMEARKDAGDNRHSMGTNWRSDPALVRAVNTVFGGVNDPFVFDEIEFEAVKHSPKSSNRIEGLADASAMQILYLGGEGHDGAIAKGWGDRHLPAITASAIAKLLTSGASIRSGADDAELTPVRPCDIAVLVRKNYQAAAVHQALRELGVPSVIESDASVFETDEASQLDRVLCGIANPTQSRSVVSALTTSILGVSGDQVCELRLHEEGWESWLSRFRRWNKSWDESGFIQAFRTLLIEEEVPQRLLAEAGGPRRLTNLYHLGELLQAKAVESKLGPHGLVRWMQRMRTDGAARAEQVGDSGKMRLESDADAVKLVTIHKSKGLEYPIVYCPFLWDGALLSKQSKETVRFHDPTEGDRLTLDIGSEQLAEHRSIAEREALAENLRLLYVALTRAKHLCNVVWGNFSGSEHSPLAYLWHREAGATSSSEGLKRSAAHIKQLDDEARRADLDALVARSKGAISLSLYRPQPPASYMAQAPDETPLRPRIAKRSVRPIGRFSSFSALVSSKRGEGEERDVDRNLEHVALMPVELGQEEGAESETVALADFPKGARIGVMIHEVFENTDFAAGDESVLEMASAEAFARYGMTEDPLERFVPAMRAALQTPLHSERIAAAPILAALPLKARLNELEFLFPVQSQGKGLTSRAIAAVMRRHPNPPWPANYPEAVAKIDFAPLTGFMRGFVDLIFCHEDRWYLADYKSNSLGPRTADYRAEALAQSMAGHHYYLQYLVYVVALHRYLQSRLPNYEYEQHIGGVFYLFVRGMDPSNTPGCGVFGDLPPLTLIHALSELFGERASGDPGAQR